MYDCLMPVAPFRRMHIALPERSDDVQEHMTATLSVKLNDMISCNRKRGRSFALNVVYRRHLKCLRQQAFSGHLRVAISDKRGEFKVMPKAWIVKL